MLLQKAEPLGLHSKLLWLEVTLEWKLLVSCPIIAQEPASTTGLPRHRDLAFSYPVHIATHSNFARRNGNKTVLTLLQTRSAIYYDLNLRNIDHFIMKVNEQQDFEGRCQRLGIIKWKADDDCIFGTSRCWCDDRKPGMP